MNLIENGTVNIFMRGRFVMETIQNTVPIYHKITLTIREAAEYSNIGINKIDQLTKKPNCPFVLYVGTKKLVKRKEFEKYISNAIVIQQEPDKEINNYTNIFLNQWAKRTLRNNGWYVIIETFYQAPDKELKWEKV